MGSATWAPGLRSALPHGSGRHCCRVGRISTSLTAMCRGLVTTNAIVRAMSSACSSSIPANRSFIRSRTSGRLWLASSVATAPGSIRLTRTCRCVTSIRRASANAPTANLLALYAPLPWRTRRPATLLVITSSVAGRQIRLGSGVYNASKHAVGAFAEALRMEVTERHVRVSLIEPGAVETELAGHNRPEVQERMRARFEGVDRLQADDIARTIAFVVTSPRHMAVNEVLIRPTQQQQ